MISGGLRSLLCAFDRRETGQSEIDVAARRAVALSPLDTDTEDLEASLVTEDHNDRDVGRFDTAMQQRKLSAAFQMLCFVFIFVPLSFLRLYEPDPFSGSVRALVGIRGPERPYQFRKRKPELSACRGDGGSFCFSSNLTFFTVIRST